MGLIENYKEVSITRRNAKYYSDLGYDIPEFKGKDFSSKIILVKSSDVNHKSKITMLDFECDNCHKKFTRNAENYYRRLEETGSNKTYCVDCYYVGAEETKRDRYGENYQEHLAEMNKKRKSTCISKYGVEHPLQLKEFVEKAQSTCLKKYGVKSYSQLDEQREFSKKLFKNNGLVCCSKAQSHIADLLNSETNYLYHGYYLDIFYDNWLDIEYDGSGHRIRVRDGDMTDEEFDKQERRRYAAIHSYGLKTITIIGNKYDILPEDKELLSDIMAGIDYLKNNNDKSYIIDYSNTY